MLGDLPRFSKALAVRFRQSWVGERSEHANPEREQISLIERIERALVLLAYFIELDGDVYVPMYEKFEAELEELKKKEGIKDRARRLLLAYSRSGERKAIASKNLSFNSRSYAPSGCRSGCRALRTPDPQIRSLILEIFGRPLLHPAILSPSKQATDDQAISRHGIPWRSATPIILTQEVPRLNPD